ncbi:acyl-CoA carboxylase subunit epsilon [Nocardioides sp.]|uniref:acyl-CoA carboxylase subunit epsilon n=1 Tax=Nocardioides sp. TaxID=35761 RepID=UPI00344520CE
MTAPADHPTRPLLRVVRGNPTPDEIAALTAVVTSLPSHQIPPPLPAPHWFAHHHKLRTPHPHGPDGWRASTLAR